MIEKGFCQCGCGGRTKLAKQNDKKLGYTKGQPVRFLQGHFSKTDLHLPKNGQTISSGYLRIRVVGHPRSTEKGKYVFEHILRAEKALEKPLPLKAIVHHHPSKNNFNTIVICEDHHYHMILHARYRALKECGHANWRKCSFCKKYDILQNLYLRGYATRHRNCHAKYEKNRLIPTRAKNFVPQKFVF
jgi:hypothetical protein